MAFEQIVACVDRLRQLEDTRRARFREELESYESGADTEFDRTRATIEEERDALIDLDSLLEEERGQLSALDEQTAHLSVDQAVRHREASLEKLTAHNDRLRTFHDSLSTALDVIEVNLDALEKGGIDGVRQDPQPHLEESRAALEAHNEVVEGLRENMTILNAYLV